MKFSLTAATLTGATLALGQVTNTISPELAIMDASPLPYPTFLGAVANPPEGAFLPAPSGLFEAPVVAAPFPVPAGYVPENNIGSNEYLSPGDVAFSPTLPTAPGPVILSGTQAAQAFGNSNNEDNFEVPQQQPIASQQGGDVTGPDVAEASYAAVVAGARSLPICVQRCIAQGIQASSCSEDDLTCICQNIQTIDPAWTCAEATCYGESWKNGQQIFNNLCRDFQAGQFGEDIVSGFGADRGEGGLERRGEANYEGNAYSNGQANANMMQYQQMQMPSYEGYAENGQYEGAGMVPAQTVNYAPHPTPAMTQVPAQPHAAQSTSYSTMTHTSYYYPYATGAAMPTAHATGAYGYYNQSTPTTAPIGFVASEAGVNARKAGWLLALGGLVTFWL